MLKDLTVSKSITINADVHKVWKGLTNPEIIKEYLYGTNTITDWKEGSEIIFHGDYEGMAYRDHGLILKNIPFSVLSYSYWSGFSGLEDSIENFSTITYGLVECGDNETMFTWTQHGYATEEGYKHSLEGMESFLVSVKEVIEKT
ncbi:MAG: SRPBCC domain-containing protein [Saprospiraceae bacterium]|nr:SRPBCC domain-containing protein [Saprospiraceae bacterium]